MRELFQQELAELKDDLVDIAQSVESAMSRAVEAFNKSDVQLAEEVIAQDHMIDDAVKELDEQSIAILARQSPVAGDLRQDISPLRISSAHGRFCFLSERIS